MEIYVVKRGDTLFRIARRCGLSTEELASANQLRDPGVLSVGQALVIPGGSTLYTVRRGDTLWRIARARGVSLERLLAANPAIRDPDRIYPGQTVVIPAEGGGGDRIVVNGYASDVTDASLRAALPWLTLLSPFSFRTDIRGELTPTYRVNTALSAAQRTANLLTVTNLRENGGFSSDIAHAVLTDEEVQSRFFASLDEALDGGGWYGVNVDFEYVYPFDRESYSQFVRLLSERLHAGGKILVTALAPKISDSQQGTLYAAHDYAVHGTAADYVVLMTYEWGYTYGPAMAVSPVNRVRGVLDYAVTVIPRGKILLGIPNYGYDWTLPFVQGSAARALTNTAAAALAGRERVEIHFDAAAQAPFFFYNDDAGRRHEVWFEDARSLRAKYRLVDEYGLGGVSFWNLNSLFRTAFLVLGAGFSVEKSW